MGHYIQSSRIRLKNYATIMKGPILLEWLFIRYSYSQKNLISKIQSDNLN